MGDYVEARIRPHSLGRFEDLLRETARHPAMLRYLDNASSGPSPNTGNRALQGITENCARGSPRSCTLGVDGGYQQGDVIAVARIPTGWTAFQPGPDGRSYEFRFERRLHDRKAKKALGVDFPPAVRRTKDSACCASWRCIRAPPSIWRASYASASSRTSRRRSVSRSRARRFCLRRGISRRPCRRSSRPRRSGRRNTGRPSSRRPSSSCSAPYAARAPASPARPNWPASPAYLGEVPFLEPSPRVAHEESSYSARKLHARALGVRPRSCLRPGARCRVRSAWRAGWRRELANPRSQPERNAPRRKSDPRTVTTIEQAVAAAPDEVRWSRGLALCLSAPEFQWRWVRRPTAHPDVFLRGIGAALSLFSFRSADKREKRVAGPRVSESSASSTG